MKNIGDSAPYSTSRNGKWTVIYHPIIAACIFVLLVRVFFLGGYGPELAGQELPLSFGILAYSLVLAKVFFPTRPRFLERKTGLVPLYAIYTESWHWRCLSWRRSIPKDLVIVVLT